MELTGLQAENFKGIQYEVESGLISDLKVVATIPTDRHIFYVFKRFCKKYYVNARHIPQTDWWKAPLKNLVIQCSF